MDLSKAASGADRPGPKPGNCSSVNGSAMTHLRRRDRVPESGRPRCRLRLRHLSLFGVPPQLHSVLMDHVGIRPRSAGSLEHPVEVAVDPIGHLWAGQLGRVDGVEAELRPHESLPVSPNQVRVLRQRDVAESRHVHDPLIVGNMLIRAVRVELGHQHDDDSPIPQWPRRCGPDPSSDRGRRPGDRRQAASSDGQMALSASRTSSTGVSKSSATDLIGSPATTRSLTASSGAPPRTNNGRLP